MDCGALFNPLTFIGLGGMFLGILATLLLLMIVKKKVIIIAPSGYSPSLVTPSSQGEGGTIHLTPDPKNQGANILEKYGDQLMKMMTTSFQQMGSMMNNIPSDSTVRGDDDDEIDLVMSELEGKKQD